MPEHIWTCKIGGEIDGLPGGSDLPMRRAVERAYREITGRDPEFLFSGWAGSLTEPERAVVEDRMPDPDVIVAEARTAIDDAAETMDSALRWKEAEAASAPSEPQQPGEQR